LNRLLVALANFKQRLDALQMIGGETQIPAQLTTK
jgi:hypothetical protein